MGKGSSSSSSSSSSSWSSFLLGSATTAVSIYLYQNRKSLFGLYRELKEEYNEEQAQSQQGNNKTESSKNRDLVVPDLGKLGKSSMGLALDKEEQLGFLTDIVKQLWPYINIAGSDTIRDTAEPMFKDLMPGPLSTMHFTKIDLGTIPIRLDNVVIHDVDLESNTLQFDMDVIWDGNCDIKLKADYIGSFGVKSIKMRGRMSILMRPLVPTTSVVAGIQYGFINTPNIKLNYSGMAHFADIKVIDSTITQIMQTTVNSMMVLPRRRLYKMDKGCDFTKIYKPPLGIARINVMRGRGFVVEKGLLVDDIPDCYCILKLGDLEHRTSTVVDNLSPVWNETVDFVLSDHDQLLNLQCWDEDEGILDPDDDLGTAVTTPGEITLSGGVMELPLQQESRNNGAFVTLGCQVLNLTTSSLDSLKDTTANHVCGLLTILVLQAFDIPLSKEEAATFVQVTCGTSTFTTSAVVDYPGVDCLNPWYDKAFLVELKPSRIKDGKVPSVKLELINGTNTDMGSFVLTHNDLVTAEDHTVATTRSIGHKGAKLRFQVCLQGVEEPPAPSAAVSRELGEEIGEVLSSVSSLSDEVARDLVAAGATPSKLRKSPQPSALHAVVNSPPRPLRGVSSAEGGGSGGGNDFASALDQATSFDESHPASVDQSHVRITAVKGKGFKVRKTIFFKPDDVPDVYLNITFGSSPQIWRTKTARDSLYPVWNESKDFVLHSHGQVINIEVYDDEESGKERDDIHYGSIRVTVGKVLLAGGIVHQEIMSEGKGTGAFITLKCQLVNNN